MLASHTHTLHPFLPLPPGPRKVQQVLRRPEEHTKEIRKTSWTERGPHCFREISSNQLRAIITWPCARPELSHACHKAHLYRGFGLWVSTSGSPGSQHRAGPEQVGLALMRGGNIPMLSCCCLLAWLGSSPGEPACLIQHRLRLGCSGATWSEASTGSVC